MEEKIEMDKYQVLDYDLKVEAPKNWENTRVKLYAKNLNNSLSLEEKAAYRDKVIPFDEKYAVVDYIPQKEITSVPKMSDYLMRRLAVEKYKKKGRERNWFSTLFRSGWNNTLDIAQGAYSYVAEFPQALGAGAAWLENKEELSSEGQERWKKDLAKDVLEKNEKDKKAVDKFKFDVNPYESQSAKGLGSLLPVLTTTGVIGGARILAGKGLGAAIEANAPIATIFGLSSAEDMFQQVLENGGSIVEATVRSELAGLGETALEQSSLISFNRFYKKKHLPFMLLGAGVSEGMQEGGQSAKDIAIAGEYDTRTADQKLDDIFDSTWYGALGGMTFGLGGAKSSAQFLKMWEKVYDAAINAGKDPKTALKIAQGAVPSEGQITEDATEFLNEYVNTFPPITQEQMDSFRNAFIEAVETGGEDAAQYLAAKESLQEKLSEVLPENEAQEQSSYWTGMAIKDYQLTKDEGKIPDMDFEEFANLHFALNRLRIKNYAQMTEEEKEEIWQERLAETAKPMSDEDRYREESGIGKLYSAAMYRSPLKDFGAFYDDVMRGKNKKPRFYTKTVDGVELDIPSNALHHDNNKHSLTKEEWNGILQAINDNRIDEARLGDYSRMNGVPVKMVVDVDGVKYGVTFEHMNNGRNLIQTAFELTDKGWIKNKSSQTVASEPQPKSSRLGNSMSAIISNLDENVKEENKLYSEALGSYDMDKQVVELMKGRNPSTLTHELSHHFFISHIRLMEEMGLNDRNKPVFDWLSKKGGHEINSLKDIQRADWENMTEAFIEYMNTNEAPNLATKSLFQRAKEWLLDNYKIHRTEASPEIRDYFDNLISRDTAMPDMSKVKNQLGHISEMLAQAQRGESVTFKDIGKKELQDLQRALHTRIRRKGMSLKDELIASGGIKEGTELAKQLGFDVLKKDKMWTNKETAISKEDELIEWLSDKGYITPVQEGETAENVSKRWDEVQRLIDDAENVYTPKEQAINQERETAIRNQAYAQEVVDALLKDNKLGLKTINDLDNLLSRTISKQDNVDIVKVNENALKYINVATKDANRMLRNTLNQTERKFKNQREEQYQAQNDLKDYIRSLPINGQHKVSLMGNIQRVKGYDSLRDVLNSIKPRIEGYIEQESKHLYKNIIDDTLKSTRPKSKNKQNYLYEDNKLFAELRDIRTMDKEKAIEKLEERLKVQNSEEISDSDLLINQMLGYKVQGMENSVAAMKTLSDNLVFAKNNAIQNKEDFDIARSEKRREEREKMLTYLKNTPKSNKFVEKLVDLNSDFYTLTSEMFGKEWADKYEMLSVFGEQETDYANRVFAADEQGQKIYGAKDGYEFIDMIGEKSKKQYHLQGTNANAEYSEDISLLDIMDIYLGMKNKETKENFLRNYEEFDADGTQLTNQLDSLINNLSVEDRRFADMLQKEVQKYRDKENEAFIKRFGIDMPDVENYWMRTSMHTDTDIDAYRELALSIPSMFKARSSTVIPEPRNAYEKFKRHTADSSYAINVFDKYKEIYDLVKNDAVVRAIRSKYGDNRWNELRSVLQGMGAKQFGKTYSELGSAYNGFISRIVGAKVKASFSVFVKQLVSVTNYAENMPIDEYTKNMAFAIAHPKQAEEFVRKYIGDFVDARYKLGRQNQALAAEVAQSRQGKQGFIKAGTKAKLDDFFSYGIRKGDILPIIKGGYAKAKYMAEQGKSYDEIRKILIRETLRSQQAGNAASVSNFQRQHSLLSAYQNTAYQYARILNTAYIQYKRGEISREQFAKTYLNYGVVQPLLYVTAGYFASSFMHLGDDEWEGKVPFLDFITEMLAQPLGVVPLAKDAVKIAANKIADEKIYAVEPVVLADINKSIRKLSKKNIELMDWVDIFTPVMEGILNVPAGQIMRWVKLGGNILD